ncbi:putative methyltransferase-domain-containing protein, partial [Pyronema omphalodes]
MQYIRFLKTPRYKPLTKRDGVISALITICTDLGESFLYRDITLIAIVRDIDNGEEAIAHKAFLWKAGMRSLKIEVPVRNKSKSKHSATGKNGKEEDVSVILQISEKDFTLSDQLVGEDKVAVMSLWSSPLSISSSSEEMEQKQERVQRRIDIGQETPLCVFEETRDSIAKHIWDGGIAFTAYLTRVFAEVGDGKGEEEEQENEGQEWVKEFDTLLREKKDLKVLELGAGCGIVGLTLSRFLPTSEITLTDLPTAHEICTHNLQFLPPSSRATFRVLDWD